MVDLKDVVVGEIYGGKVNYARHTGRPTLRSLRWRRHITLAPTRFFVPAGPEYSPNTWVEVDVDTGELLMDETRVIDLSRIE